MAEERRSDRTPRSGGRGGRPGGTSGSGRSGQKPAGGTGRSAGGRGRGDDATAGPRRSGQGFRPGAKPGKPGQAGASKGFRDSKGSADSKPGERKSYGSRDGGRDGGGRERSREGGRGPRDRDSSRGTPRSGGRRPYERDGGREVVERTADQRAYDGPDLPADITGKELDRALAAQLRGLPEKLANRVARHLVAASMFIDQDPELAYQHAKAAKARTQRLAVIREALGEAAYAAGHYAEALAELRAAKRMNGATAYLPIMADCHRALGQPQQAIKLAHSPSVANFAADAKAEMTIVEAGARRDMKQYDAALRILEQAPLNNKSRAPWVVRLRYAYADTLAAAGRSSEALEWFHRTHAIDADELTDAADRAESLEKQLGD